MDRQLPTLVQQIQTSAQVPPEIRLDERLQGEMQNE